MLRFSGIIRNSDYENPVFEIDIAHGISKVDMFFSPIFFSRQRILIAFFCCYFRAAGAPLRLLTMRNGVRDISKALAVVGPDLSNVSHFCLFLPFELIELKI